MGNGINSDTPLLDFNIATPRDKFLIWNEGIHCIDIPLPKTTDISPAISTEVRLRTAVHLSKGPTVEPNPVKGGEPNLIIFRFESTNYKWNVFSLNNHDIDHYFSDIKSIIEDDYGFSGFTYEESPSGKEFLLELSLYAPIYSVEEFKFILYVYKNPIEFKNNYLQVNTNYANTDFIYSVNMGTLTIFFDISLNEDETYCITRIFWLYQERLKFDLKEPNPFDYTELQQQVNCALYRELSTSWFYEFIDLAEEDPNYTGEDMHMAFKYYREGVFEGLQSICDFHNNNYSKRYLTFLLTYRLMYISPRQAWKESSTFWKGYDVTKDPNIYRF